MRQQSSSEIELELTPEIKSKSQQISLFVILALLIYTITMFEYILPIPIGMIILYIFKEFKGVAVRALLMSNIIDFITVIPVLNIVMLSWVLFSFVLDLGFIGVFVENDYKFNDRTMWKFGFVLGIMSIILVLPITMSFMSTMPYYLTISPILEVFLYSMVFVICIVAMAYSTKKTLKSVIKGVNRLFNMDKIKLV